MKKKSKEQYEEMKNKLEKLEYDYEQNMNKLVEERNNLKKTKQTTWKKKQEGDDEGGFVNKDVLVQTQNDYEKQIDELRLQLEEERKLKVQMESEKRQIEFKLLESRDQLELEERAKRKLALSRKALTIEMEELKELADEAEDLNEELEKVKQEGESQQTELKNDLGRERNARQGSENQLNQIKKKNWNHWEKKLKMQEMVNLKKLNQIKKKYEQQLSELDNILQKTKREKKRCWKIISKIG